MFGVLGQSHLILWVVLLGYKPKGVFTFPLRPLLRPLPLSPLVLASGPWGWGRVRAARCPVLGLRWDAVIVTWDEDLSGLR